MAVDLSLEISRGLLYERREAYRCSAMEVYQLSDILRVTSSSAFETSLIDAIADGFISYSRGEFNACPIQTMGAPPMGKFSCEARTSRDDVDDNDDESEYAAQVCIKSGYVTGAEHFVVKVASGGHPMPSNSGCMQVYSQHTGKLVALLLDDGVLTELRTAAAGAVAARFMAPKNLKRIGMLGTGIQARYQLRLLKHVTRCRDLMVYGRTADNVQKYVDDCKNDGWNVAVASCPNVLLDSCELIVTTTTAREPVLGTGGKCSTMPAMPEQHITCIGADAPGKMELDSDLVKSAKLLVADSRLQTRERGEFQKAVNDGLVSLDEDILEIGEIAQLPILPCKLGGVDNREAYAGKLNAVSSGCQESRMQRCKEILSEMLRSGPNCGLSIFDSSGVAVQDCVVADMVYAALSSAEGRS